jgi:L-alanine-DL-glutamate epimerase-like enolase superfamily enzyme
MTTIEHIRLHPVRVALHTPFVTSLRRATHAESLLVEVVDSDGRSGWGEAPQVWQVTGESIAGAAAAIDGPLSGQLIGRDPADLIGLTDTVERAIVGNLSAKSAIDVALHDLFAGTLGIPLARFLGAPADRHRITTDVTLSVGTAAAVAADAVAKVAAGFTLLKAKVGTDARGDVERVRAIRAAVGPGIGIRLDANQGWTVKEAIATMTAVEAADLDVELVEQPLPAHDLAGMAAVTARIATPVLADESVYGIRDLVGVIETRAADMVNVKLAKCGGLRVARTLLDLARAHGLGTVVGSMMETSVGIGAAASLVAAYDSPATGRHWAVSDLDAAWWLAEPAVVGGAAYDGPVLTLADAPGLGITALATSAHPSR